MKKYLHILSAFSLLCATAYTQQKDTIYITDFGAAPYLYESCVTQIQAAIDGCEHTGAKVFSLPNGRYDIWPEGTTHKEYSISNASTKQECPPKVKTVGLTLDKINNLTIEGNGATLMYHGKMTTLTLEHCNHIGISNLHIDFERPTGSEIQYKKVTEGETEVSVHLDTHYEIVDGKIDLYGEGRHSSKNHRIECSPNTESLTYNQRWNILANSATQEISPGIIHFATSAGFTPKVGNTPTIRDIIRDQVGLFILESKDITLSRVRMYYIHRLGIVSQYIGNVTMDGVRCIPRPGGGRLLTASTDMMHFSGCKGKISVDNCYFVGAQGDPVSVHGTNLRAIEKVDAQTLRLRFMHGQSYGFDAYFKGDAMAFVRAATMERFTQATVQNVARISDRILEVRSDRDIPASMELNHDCMENMTCTPEVEIRNSYFTRTSTRSILVTTLRKVVIEDNMCYKTGMSAILIEVSAEGWYESGPVKDAWVRGNTLIDYAHNRDPGHAVIAVHPSSKIVDASHPVHQDVRVEDNTFRTFNCPVLYAKSTAGLLFRSNIIIRARIFPATSGNPYTLYLNGYENAMVENAVFEGEVLGWNMKAENVKRDHLKTTLE